jgi:hypothetical protein
MNYKNNPLEMDLFALRRPCLVKCDVHLAKEQRKAKKDNPLRTLRLCGELLPKLLSF